MKKRRSEKLHAKKRAKQRYKIDLSHEEYEALCRQIRDGESIFVKKQSNTRTIHDVTYKNKVMRAVYDKLRKCIVTFLHL